MPRYVLVLYADVSDLPPSPSPGITDEMSQEARDSGQVRLLARITALLEAGADLNTKNRHGVAMVRGVSACISAGVRGY